MRRSTLTSALGACVLLLLLAGCLVSEAEAAKSKRSTKRGPDAFEEEIPGTNYAAQEDDQEGQCVGEHCQNGGGGDYQDDEAAGGEGEEEEEEEEGPPVDESNVLVLTKDNFHSEVKKHPFSKSGPIPRTFVRCLVLTL